MNYSNYSLDSKEIPPTLEKPLAEGTRHEIVPHPFALRSGVLLRLLPILSRCKDRKDFL